MTSPFNPYQAPAADELSTDELGGTDGLVSRKATRSERLLAAIIDSLIGFATLGPLQWKLGVYANFPNIRKQSLAETAAWAGAAVLIWCLVNGYFLVTNSQTIGKRVAGIRIENYATEQRTPAWKIVVVRYLPIVLCAQIPIVGQIATLVDVLLIFRRDHRCLHDHIAGTVVVKARA